MDISALLRILMACEKTGTESFLGYPVTLLIITKVLYNYFICKTVISFPAKTLELCVLYGFP